MRAFYTQCKAGRHIELSCYFLIFVFITSLHLLIGIPVVTLCANILTLTFLTFLYESTIKRALLVILIIILTLGSIEVLGVVLTGSDDLHMLAHFEHDSILGLVTARLLTFIFVVLVQRFRKVGKYELLPFRYWLILCLIPIGTFIVLFTIFSRSYATDILVIISIISVFAINLFAFYLSDLVSTLMEQDMERRILEKQESYYEQQLQMMESALEHYRIIKHDLRNKLTPLNDLAEMRDYDALTTRLADLTEICEIETVYSSSGNNVVDSLLNFKLQSVEEKEIDVSTSMNIPADLPIPLFDMSALLGNIIDNALEATDYVEEKRIKIDIDYSNGLLICAVTNSYDGHLKRDNRGIVSRKDNTSKHGHGLKSIQTIVDKYKGQIDIHFTDKMFTIKVLLYI